MSPIVNSYARPDGASRRPSLLAATGRSGEYHLSQARQAQAGQYLIRQATSANVE
jgi:hypothetical protein